MTTEKVVEVSIRPKFPGWDNMISNRYIMFRSQLQVLIGTPPFSFQDSNLSSQICPNNLMPVTCHYSLIILKQNWLWNCCRLWKNFLSESSDSKSKDRIAGERTITPQCQVTSPRLAGKSTSKWKRIYLIKRTPAQSPVFLLSSSLRVTRTISTKKPTCEYLSFLLKLHWQPLWIVQCQ